MSGTQCQPASESEALAVSRCWMTEMWISWLLQEIGFEAVLKCIVDKGEA